MFHTSLRNSPFFFLASNPQVTSTAEKDLQQFGGFLHTLQEVVPGADIFVGAAMLIIIVLVHGVSMRIVQHRFVRRAKSVAQHPTVWRAELMFGCAVASLLGAHLIETGIWTTALVWGHLLPSWRAAAYFAGNTYTTVGYGTVALGESWKMLCPIIAISGLFTFGWTGSVLVDIVGRVGRLKDLAEESGSGPLTGTNTGQHVPRVGEP